MPTFFFFFSSRRRHTRFISRPVGLPGAPRASVAVKVRRDESEARAVVAASTVAASARRRRELGADDLRRDRSLRGRAPCERDSHDRRNRRGSYFAVVARSLGCGRQHVSLLRRCGSAARAPPARQRDSRASARHQSNHGLLAPQPLPFAYAKALGRRTDPVALRERNATSRPRPWVKRSVYVDVDRRRGARRRAVVAVVETLRKDFHGPRSGVRLLAR